MHPETKSLFRGFRITLYRQARILQQFVKETSCHTGLLHHLARLTSLGQ
jgi:hypothetical protein